MNIEKADITGIDAAMTADVDAAMKQYGFTLADKWILSKMNDLVQEVTDNMEKFELGIAVSKLYEQKQKKQKKKTKTLGRRRRDKGSCTLDIEDGSYNRSEAVASIYAICNRGDLLYTDRRGIYHDLQVAGI